MGSRAGLDIFWRIIKSLVPVGHWTPGSTSIISSLNLYLGHHAVPILRDFPQKPQHEFPYFSCIPHFPSILFDSTSPFYQYYVKSTFHALPHYGNLSIILLFPPYLVQIPSESPCSRTSSVYVVSPKIRNQVFHFYKKKQAKLRANINEISLISYFSVGWRLERIS